MDEQEKIVTPEQTTQAPAKSPKKPSKKFYFILCAIVVGVSLLGGIAAWVSTLFDGYSYVRVNEVVRDWNAAAEQNPGGITHGVKITKDAINQKQTIVLADGVTVQFKTVSTHKADIADVTVTLPNESALDGATLTELLGILAKDISVAEPIAKYQEEIQPLVQEEITGAHVEFLPASNKSDISFIIKPIYPYVLSLQKGSGTTGLNFGSTIEDFCSAYNQKMEDKSKGNYLLNASDEKYIRAAKSAVGDQLKSPSTASWGAATVEEKDAYGRAIVTLSVDAQNGFGAMIRGYYAVCIQGVTADDKYVCDQYVGVRTYDPQWEQLGINEVKQLNDFGEPRNAGNITQPGDFSIRTIGSYQVYEYQGVMLFVEPATNKICSVWILADEVPEDSSTTKTIVGFVTDFPTGKMPGFDALVESGATYTDGIMFETVKRASQTAYCATAITTQLYEQGLRTSALMD